MAEKDYIRYDTLPGHMQDGARAYIEDGIPAGGFLTAALEDKLVQAFARADSENTARMRDWAGWLYNEVPMSARGSEKNVKAWIKIGGLNGIERKNKEEADEECRRSGHDPEDSPED